MAPWSAFAHHSISGIYEMGETATLEGRVTKVDFINPHIAFEVSVSGAGGATQIWKLESRSPRGMERNGVTASTVKVGAMVKVTGHPGRNGARTMWPVSLEAGGATFDLRRRPATSAR
jgi:Family of unknown function (DUF6152)